MSVIDRILRRPAQRPGETLYAAVVARARQPHWYLAGAVPDTIDGRFDMVAAVLAMVLLRLETDDEAAGPLATSLAECFIDDMDVQLRQQGVGDVMVGKHVGRMMGMLGGRLTVYRAGADDPGIMDQALIRNVYRGDAPDPSALAHVRDSLAALRSDLTGMGLDRLRAGILP